MHSSLKNLSDLLFVDWFSLIVKFELELTASHTEDLEPIDLWNELGWPLGQQLWEVLEENVREASAKVGSVDVELLLAWNIDILTPRTVHLDT